MCRRKCEYGVGSIPEHGENTGLLIPYQKFFRKEETLSVFPTTVFLVTSLVTSGLKKHGDTAFMATTSISSVN